LQTTAPIFFGDLNEIFIEQLVQRICRLTDGARTMGRKNLTIKFLIEHSDFSAAPGTLDRLSALSDSIHRFRNRSPSASDAESASRSAKSYGGAALAIAVGDGTIPLGETIVTIFIGRGAASPSMAGEIFLGASLRSVC
jgi:hypothetical protein